MRNLGRVITSVLLVALVWFFAAKTAKAQDPVKVAPGQYKVLLENERVRVLEVIVKPHEKTPMHSHPANVVYSFSDAKTRFTPAGGKAFTAEMKTGAASWNGAQKHMGENVGTTDTHVLVVELKGGKAGKTAKGADPVRVDAKHFKVLLNNARVRVLEFRGKPGDKFPMHSHPDYVAYTFSGGKTTYSFPDGKTAERQVSAGSASWNESETHAGQIGDTETHTLLVELKATRATPKK